MRIAVCLLLALAGCTADEPTADLDPRPMKDRPLFKLLSYVLPRLEKMDANRFFALPVSDKIAPGKTCLHYLSLASS